MRRRIALIAAFLSSAAFAAVPSTVASGDSAGGTAAPSGAALQGQPPPPPLAASPGHPALEPSPGAVVRQTITLNGAVAPDDAGRPVAVQQRFDDGEWTDVGTVPSASDGSFSVRWRPTATGAAGHHREPVHGRVRKRRHVARGGDVACDHAPERRTDRHVLRSQRADGGKDDPPRLVDRGHTGMIAYPTLNTPSAPSWSAVAFVRSKLAPLAYGPRSITGTVTVRPP